MIFSFDFSCGFNFRNYTPLDNFVKQVFLNQADSENKLYGSLLFSYFLKLNNLEECIFFVDKYCI